MFWSNIRTDSADKQILYAVSWNPKQLASKPVNFQQFELSRNKILNYLENNGYPFASVKLDSIQIANGSLEGKLVIDKGPLYRIDSLRNLVEDPRIGLIFLVPGANETYRVNGLAEISQDAELKRRFAVNGKEPATVMVVTVEETFPHCAKALMRSDLWKAGSRGRPQGVPTLGDFVAARNPGTDSAAFNATYNERMPRELY